MELLMLGLSYKHTLSTKIFGSFEESYRIINTYLKEMNTGPLYGIFTDEIIDYCKKHKKTVNFHYYI